MRAVWLDNDYSLMPYAPQDDYERLYIASYLRISGVDQGHAADRAPDARITTLTELPAAVDGIGSLPVINECMECAT
jgi:hypothetical protein